MGLFFDILIGSAARAVFGRFRGRNHDIGATLVEGQQLVWRPAAADHRD